MIKEDMELLAGALAAPCISIYRPTHGTGEAVPKDHDWLLPKNLLKAVKPNLADQRNDQKAFSAHAAPIQELIDAKLPWNFSSDVLALFISPQFFMTLQPPIKFSPWSSIPLYATWFP